MAIIDDIVGGGATRVVIEGRAGRDQLDRRVIRQRLVSYPRSPLTYEHLLPVEDPILWVADAFAWVAGAGGEWTDRCGNVLGIVDIEP